jgi:hypothetical protein
VPVFPECPIFGTRGSAWHSGKISSPIVVRRPLGFVPSARMPSRAPAREAVATYDAGNKLCRDTNDDGWWCDLDIIC